MGTQAEGLNGWRDVLECTTFSYKFLIVKYSNGVPFLLMWHLFLAPHTPAAAPWISVFFLDIRHRTMWLNFRRPIYGEGLADYSILWCG